MARSVPQIISIAAICLGIALFVVTLLYIDLEETVASARRLGLALPFVLLPSAVWQVLRTWGWAISFPEDSRPPFTRLFRVRLAADAISFFTIRGVAGEPLKVLLLLDRSAPQVTTASIALERLAVAIMSIAVAGLISFFAVTRLALPRAWDTVFGALIVLAVLLVPTPGVHRPPPPLGRLSRAHGRGIRPPDWPPVRHAARGEVHPRRRRRAPGAGSGDRRRLVILFWLPIVCYGVIALEIWAVFWAIGEPIGLMEGLTIETPARLGRCRRPPSRRTSARSKRRTPRW